MVEVYQLGYVHREAHARRCDLYSQLRAPDGQYDGPMYRSPDGYAVFMNSEHEAGFQRAHLAAYGSEHTDPCTAAAAAAG
jgi:hypothetical protein